MVAELVEPESVVERAEPENPKQRPFVDGAVIQAIWEAEDGRCEACKRPMACPCARMLPITPDLPESEWVAENLHLVCHDCLYRRPDYLSKLVMSPTMREKLVKRVGEDRAEALGALLLKALQQYGVLLTSQKEWRAYWLPGIGHFKVEWGGFGKPSEVVLQHMYPVPELRVKPQARTRGLPKPDRSPLKKEKPKREKKPKEPQVESTVEETPTPVGVG